MTAKETLRAQYDEQGYVQVPNVLDEALIGETREHLDWLAAKYPDLRPEQYHSDLMGKDPFWHRLISDDRLLDIAEAFIGPDIALFATHYISKPAYDGQPVLWHQDGSYWPLEPMDVVTLWLAVDDSVPENGCMRVIPGTQHMDLQEMIARNDVENVLGSAIDSSLVDESSAVDIVLPAGSVSVHHPNVIHGSNANLSPMRRAGLTIRYIPTSTRIKVTPWHSGFLLRGKPVEGINDYLSKPRFVPGEHMPFRGSEAYR